MPISVPSTWMSWCTRSCSSVAAAVEAALRALPATHLRPPIPYGVQIHGKRLDAPPVHRPHREHRVARRHPVAHYRQPPERAEHVAADRRVFVVGDVEAEPF